MSEKITASLSDEDIELLRADVRALRELSESRGWAIVQAAIKDDVLSASFALADSPVMTEKEVDYRRGAISAARNMLRVVEVLQMHKDNALLLASATAEVIPTRHGQ